MTSSLPWLPKLALDSDSISGRPAVDLQQKITITSSELDLKGRSVNGTSGKFEDAMQNKHAYFL